MVFRRALEVGVGREAVLRLGDADRKPAVAGLLVVAELIADLLVRDDVLGAVDRAGDGPHLVPERHVVGVERAELRGAALRETDDLAGEGFRSLSAVRSAEHTSE